MIEKYTRFVEESFPKLSKSIVIVVAFLVTGYLIVQSFIPMSAKELEQHNEKLELLKDDFPTLSQMKGVTQEVSEDTIIVTFDGKECDMKAVFDKHGTYKYRIIIDDRICTNFGRSCLAILLVVTATWIVLTVLEVILLIPLSVSALHKRKCPKE